MKKRIVDYIIIGLVITIVIVLFIMKKNEPFTFTTNMTNISIKINDYKKIDYQISDKSISINWKSNNENVASVDQNGIVHGNSLGTTTIIGEANRNDQVETIQCIINVVADNYDVHLQDFTLPNGEILITKGQTYTIPISYIPYNGYVGKIEYTVNNDNIAINNGIISAIKEGSTIVSITINNSITKKITVNVTKENVTSQIMQPVNNVNLESNEIEISINENKKINYTIEPNNSTIFNTSWTSFDNDIAKVSDDGTITGVSTGNTIITLTVNNNIQKTIKVNVKQGITDIVFNYNPKKILKIGEVITLHPTIIPSTISNSTLTYKSSNNNIISVDSNGNVTANGNGDAIVTVKDITGKISKNISFTVVPKQGALYTDKTIWAFEKEEDAIPQKADINFFTNLAQNGKGTISNNIYIYQNYIYDIKNSVLQINKDRKILMRMYYPPNKDLSTLNTFTFIGGVGEENFKNYFYKIDNHNDIIKSSGIIILIANGSSIEHKGENVAEATNFVKSIINQNQYARNIVGGYSNGGPVAGVAATNGKYDKIMLINTSFYQVASKSNLANTEIVIYTAQDDSWIGTDKMINEFIQNGFNNVTIVTNNNNFTNKYKNNYLVINPGNSMKKGHTSENLTLSHYFSYGCD